MIKFSTVTSRESLSVDGFSSPAARHSRIAMSRKPWWETDVMRATRPSWPRSLKTSAGRALAARPDVKGKTQMHTSGKSTVSIIDGVFLGVVDEELLVGHLLPSVVVGVPVHKDNTVAFPWEGKAEAIAGGSARTGLPVNSVSNSRGLDMTERPRWSRRRFPSFLAIKGPMIIIACLPRR